MCLFVHGEVEALYLLCLITTFSAFVLFTNVHGGRMDLQVFIKSSALYPNRQAVDRVKQNTVKKE